MSGGFEIYGESSSPDSRNMRELLDLGHYEAYESGHPGYLRNVEIIVQQVRGLWSQHRRHASSTPFLVLELGAGPGTLLTKRLGDLLEEHAGPSGDAGAMQVLVNEYDPASVAVIRERQRPRAAANELERRPVLSPLLQVQAPGNVLDLLTALKARGSRLDAIVSNFALHHLTMPELRAFFVLAAEVLKPGGKVLTGEEHLAHSETPSQRAAVQIEYHGRVIEEAMAQGLVKMPELEFAALVSGLKTTQEMTPPSSARAMADANDNREACRLLAALIGRLEILRARFERQTMAEWETEEPRASQDGQVTSDEERGFLLQGMRDLQAKLAARSLAARPLAGLSAEVEVYDPDKRMPIRHTPIDRKVTLEQFMRMAGGDDTSRWAEFVATRTGAGAPGEIYAPEKGGAPPSYWQSAPQAEAFVGQTHSGVYVTAITRGE